MWNTEGETGRGRKNGKYRREFTARTTSEEWRRERKDEDRREKKRGEEKRGKKRRGEDGVMRKQRSLATYGEQMATDTNASTSHGPKLCPSAKTHSNTRSK